MGLRFHKGTLFGFLTSISQFNVPIFGPIVLASGFAQMHLRKPVKSDNILVNLIFFKLIWIVLIQVSIGQLGLNQILIYLMGDIIVLSFVFLRAQKVFVASYLKSVFALFLVDVVFNIMTKVFGADPFGREAGLRPDDVISRVGGLFGHPFISVQIAVVAFVAGIALQKKWMVVLAAIGLMLNGTLRSPLSLLLLCVILVLIARKPRLWIMTLVLVTFACFVFAVTIWSASLADYANGNVLRVFAWTNAIGVLSENFFFGFHSFALGEFEKISFETITDYGIAETYYLDTWLRFGIFAPLISLCLFWIFFKRSIQDFRLAKHDPFIRAKILIVAFTFCDLFYGNFFGTVLTSTTFAILATSYECKET